MNFLKKNTGILIRFDDIAANMNWELMDKCEKLLDTYKIKPVVGVIPNNKDDSLLSFPGRKNFWQIVNKWQLKGWEVAMHGYTHIYDKDTHKKDFFNYGGKSEFFGHSVDDQIVKIKKGLKIFKDNNIKIRVFFAPNHTYDKNTFEALKISGINEVIDGYGLIPYQEKDIIFIPQLFYKLFVLPFGIQSTQIHLNEWKLDDFFKFETFIEKNAKKIICYEEAIQKVNNEFTSSFLNLVVKKFVKTKRIFS